jgi:DNA helicase-2/ATP-dependent DNA helicase PcrA
MVDIENLNAQQKLAVTTTDGPILVLAGAGSGKTKVLTYKIAYLIDTGLARATSILAVTFTNKAAGEMRERLESLLITTGLRVSSSEFKWVGTFHSICIKILKHYGELLGINTNFSIYDSQDQLTVMKEAMDRVNISTKEFNPKSILSNISSAKNNLIGTDEYAKNSYGYFQSKVSIIYPEYQKILRENNAMDFDDIIFNVVKLLYKNKEVLSNLQKNFKYILVDEYQDTNHAQYVFINLLAREHRNICCVGDDDQSIYAFRGATISNILNFENDYPEAKIIKLEQNYRSTKRILEASYNVICQNINRKDKKLWTQNPEGDKVKLFRAYNETTEADWVAAKIKAFQEQGVDILKVAVLYRTNAQSRVIEESLLKKSIPYQVVGGIRFYERKEIKDIISYLKIVQNPTDYTSLQRIINVPRRGLGDKSVEELKNIILDNNNGIFDISSISVDVLPQKFKSFFLLYQNLLNQLEEKKLGDFINYLCSQVGYIDMLDDGTSEGAARIENLKELISVASKYSIGTASENLDSFLSEVSLFQNSDEIGLSEQNGYQSKVTLMTIHSSKGLEYDHVFVVGLEENLFPHVNSSSDEDLQEERRLAYVAITRARSNLYLTCALSRQYFGKKQRNPVSRFVKEIEPELIDFESEDDSELELRNDIKNDYELKAIMLRQGDVVKHPYFGLGYVVKYDYDIAIIDFGNSFGIKELLLEYANLELVKSNK